MRSVHNGTSLAAALSASMVLCGALVGLAWSGSATAAADRGARAFSLVTGKTPRFLTAGRDATVPLRIANAGTEPWIPEDGFNLSYHWWTATGAEVEYDGLRTPLPHRVEMLEAVAIQARLHAPDHPGLYLLQWDLVQEDVAWFSQHDPRASPRILVMIVPSWVALSLPLPATFAAFAVWLGRRSRRVGQTSAKNTALSIADAGWCATSLMAKQLFLVLEAGLQLTPSQVLPRAIVAIGLPAVLTLGVESRRRPWMLWAIATAGATIIGADAIYFRYFKDVISAPVLLASSQIGGLGVSVRSLVAPRDLWLVLDLVIAVPLCAAVSRLDVSPSARRTQQLIATCCLLVVGGGWLSVREEIRREESALPRAQAFRNLSRVQVLGTFAYHAYDGWEYLRAHVLKPGLDESQLRDIERWFAERAIHRAGEGPAFGVARGRNLIVIQVESLQRFVVGLRIDGQEVTPNLNRWRDESLWFSNVTDQTSEGRTSDCEFLGLVSLLPLEHGAAAFGYPANHYTALPAVLAAHGYTTISAVAFESNFWNRRVTHPAYGFARSLFAPAFAPGTQIGWGLNDRDFLMQMLPRFTALRQPFAAWLITLSLHHPFDGFPDHLKRLNVGRWEGRPFGNYVHAMSFFDRALGEFLTALDRRGLLADTVIVILGDHDAGFPWEAAIARAAGFAPHPLNWYLQDSVPLIVHVPGSDAPRGERTLVAGQADVAPTLLALLGIDPLPLAYMGRNLLGHPGSEPVVRPYGDWVDARHLFVAGDGASLRTTCYDLSTSVAVSLEECRLGTAEAARATDVSRLVLAHDLHERLSLGTPRLPTSPPPSRLMSNSSR